MRNVAQVGVADHDTAALASDPGAPTGMGKSGVATVEVVPPHVVIPMPPERLHKRFLRAGFAASYEESVTAGDSFHIPIPHGVRQSLGRRRGAFLG